jgi:hypothetical protein
MRIIHPRPELGRQSAFGVDFIDGVATVDDIHPERERALLQHGFTVEKVLEGVKLEDLTKRELIKLATDENIDLPPRATKDQIIDALHTAPEIPVVGGDEPAPIVIGQVVAPGIIGSPEGPDEAFIPRPSLPES